MDFGSFAGGLSSGMQQGINSLDRLQLTKLRRQQLQEQQAQSLGGQAYYNSLFPGAMPMDQTQDKPWISQVPIVGPAISNLFDLQGGQARGQVQPSPQMAQGQGVPAPSEGAPIQPLPQQPSPAQRPPMPEVNPAFRPAEGEQNMLQRAAQAIDRANPGLRQNNPQAFAFAVQRAIEVMQGMNTQQATLEHLRAQTGEIGARSEMERAHGEYYRGRSQAANATNKAALEAAKQNDSTLRTLFAQRTRIQTDWSIPVAQRQAQMQAVNQEIAARQARSQILWRQAQGDFSDVQSPAEGTPTTQQPSTPLKVSDQNLKWFKALPLDKQKALIQQWRSKGVSEDTVKELAKLLEVAK